MRCLVLVPADRRPVVQAPWDVFLQAQIISKQISYTACYASVYQSKYPFFIFNIGKNWGLANLTLLINKYLSTHPIKISICLNIF